VSADRVGRSWSFDLAMLALCGGAVLAAFLLTPGAERVAILGFEIPELCGFKRFTGLPCPGCGLTRSWTYLAHGDPVTALRMNPVGPVLFLAAAIQVPLVLRRMGLRWWTARRLRRARCQS